MPMKKVNIVVIDYPGASKSAVYGFIETMDLANEICGQVSANVEFNTQIHNLENLAFDKVLDVVVLPPCVKDDFYTQESDILDRYLSTMQQQGAILASACVGAFILARGGFLDNKFSTTHWRLASLFTASFPKVKLDVNAIIVNEGNVITAGGRMAWLDLAFEIISSFCSPTVSTSLSKEMVIDTGYREQRFYSQFVPKFDHGDELIVKIQNYLSEHYSGGITVSTLATENFVSTRTLQRRFQKAVELTVIEYLQKLRLHNSCQLIELTKKSIVEISYSVGYQNVSAFRKVFYREYGLSPSDFRKRFANV